MLLVLSSAQCSVETGEAEPVAQRSDRLLTCTAYQGPWTVWHGGKIAMQPYNSHICWLTHVGGKFNGSKAAAGVTVEPHPYDGYWWLESHGSEEIGQAYCAPLSCFHGDGVNDVRWTSAGTNFSAIAVATAYSCDWQTNNTWWGDAATILQTHPGPGGWAGDCAGGGEYGYVGQSTGAFTPSWIGAHDCKWEGSCCKGIHSTATSLFVGTPSGGKPARFWGYGWVQSNYAVSLAWADEAICYFYKIGGKFRGGGEYARLETALDPGTGRYRWVLSAAHGSAGAPDGVQAEARCYYYHQWDL